LTLVEAHVVGGMSGSPILDRRARAVGLVSMGTHLDGAESRTQYGQPALVNTLPLWLLAEVVPASVLAKLPGALTAQEIERRRRQERRFEAARRRASRGTGRKVQT